MKIALINENSQAAKNEIAYNTLKKVVEPKGHTVYNYGMYTPEDDTQLTYVMAGLLSSILLETKAADFVVTGCGTGEGAVMAANAFPGVLCGHIVDPADGFLFAQINDGNAISLAFAKGFGWGAELNLEYIFEKLFQGEKGQGYPKERVEPQQRNKKILDEVKKVTHVDLLTILKNIDQEFLKTAISGPKFQEYFFANCQDQEVADYLKSVLN
ncbi:ribose 5-phosphate isomerase RpiB [Natranaerovirga hydrolytica]|uniref:Ribose 5-phosphate isomerase RpiB n=1 Tax=Natranaerovirga hydrolytica TaxID=680378 RepID=A0A4R1MN56_9FIRM|nr:RpiB/LacA/LacB family sugar-phosphate isomerase [Natranaerovirga hydrolytica]TCK92724.1 ribose 5-phosphate isomerase RpiB [Natranaerovirga hydrolytica]